MPRFYLHICNGSGFTEDEEGQEFTSAAAARQGAIKGFRDLLAGEILGGSLAVGSFIEIEDENGEVVGTVAFHDAVTLDETPCEKARRRRRPA